MQRPAGRGGAAQRGFRKARGGRQQGRGSWRGRWGWGSGAEGNTATGKRGARKGLTQEGPHPGRASREEGRGQDSAAREGPFQRGTCQQRDRPSAQAPHPKAGVGTSWELEGELNHCRVRVPAESPPEAPLLPCPGMSLHHQGASIAGSLAQDCPLAIPGALISPTRTCPSPRPTPGSITDPRRAGPWDRHQRPHMASPPPCQRSGPRVPRVCPLSPGGVVRIRPSNPHL